MKKTYLFLATVCSTLLSTTPATSEASIYPEYYSGLQEQSELRGSWTEVQGSWLLWKPCLSGMDIAATVTQTDGNRHVKYHDFDIDWQNGFRVGINTPNMFRNWNLSLDYSRMNIFSHESQFFANNDANNGIVSPMIANGISFPNTWKSGHEELDLLYQDWNLLISYSIQCDKHTLTPYLGLAALYLTQEIEGTFKNDSQRVKTTWSLDYSSIGFRSGTKYNYAFSDCLGFYADASLALLEGSDEIQFDQEGLISLSIKESDCNHQIYGHRLATGLTYRGEICCWTYNMHLGYEFASWYKVPQPRVLFGGQNPANFAQTSSVRNGEIAFHGIVWGCSVMF